MNYSVLTGYNAKINSNLFHSVLTPYLNIGLINPKKVELAIEKSQEKLYLLIPLSFIRQIIGWREFIRGIYQESGVKQRTENFWNLEIKFQCRSEGTTGL